MTVFIVMALFGVYFAYEHKKAARTAQKVLTHQASRVLVRGVCLAKFTLRVFCALRLTLKTLSVDPYFTISGPAWGRAANAIGGPLRWWLCPE